MKKTLEYTTNEEFRLYRIGTNLTQGQYGKMLGVTQKTVSIYEGTEGQLELNGSAGIMFPLYKDCLNRDDARSWGRKGRELRKIVDTKYTLSGDTPTKDEFRLLRVLFRLSQKEYGGILWVTQKAISQYECGDPTELLDLRGPKRELFELYRDFVNVQRYINNKNSKEIKDEIKEFGGEKARLVAHMAQIVEDHSDITPAYLEHGMIGALRFFLGDSMCIANS